MPCQAQGWPEQDPECKLTYPYCQGVAVNLAGIECVVVNRTAWCLRCMLLIGMHSKSTLVICIQSWAVKSSMGPQGSYVAVISAFSPF